MVDDCVYSGYRKCRTYTVYKAYGRVFCILYRIQVHGSKLKSEVIDGWTVARFIHWL